MWQRKRAIVDIFLEKGVCRQVLQYEYVHIWYDFVCSSTKLDFARSYTEMGWKMTCDSPLF